MKKRIYSPSGNRTPVSRVTGGDTHHYTNEEMQCILYSVIGYRVKPQKRKRIIPIFVIYTNTFGCNIPSGLVVRIPRSHRGGRGSIPRLGKCFWSSFKGHVSRFMLAVPKCNTEMHTQHPYY